MEVADDREWRRARRQRVGFGFCLVVKYEDEREKDGEWEEEQCNGN